MAENSCKPLRSWPVFVILWLACWTFVILSCPVFEFAGPSSINIDPHDDGINPKLVPFQYTAFDPSDKYKPIYSIALKDYNIEMGDLGPFKTGMYNTARLEDLRLSVFEYGTDCGKPGLFETKSESIIGQQPYSDSTDNDNKYKSLILSQNISSKITAKLDKIKSHIPSWDRDFRSVAELYASDFRYQLVWNNETICSVNSKRLTASFRQPEIILKGRVEITNAAGTKLKCNNARWDIENMLFKIDGFYAMDENGIVHTGSGGCFDIALNSDSDNNNNQPEETRKCLAKSP